MQKLTFKKMCGHFKTTSRHKWEVFKNSVHAGIPWRGFVHDFSKFSPLEFFSQARYYQGGKSSPIDAEKMDLGYSRAWLHHRGRSPHHWEYWVDGLGGITPTIKSCYIIAKKFRFRQGGRTQFYSRKTSPTTMHNAKFQRQEFARFNGRSNYGTPIKMPLKYAIEMLCDFIAAGKIYLGKDFTNENPLKHTTNALNNHFMKLHPKTAEFILAVETEYKKEGPKALKKAKQIAKDIGYDDAPNVMDDSLSEFAKMSVNLNKTT